jgi:integrase
MSTYTLRQHDNGIWYIHWTEDRRSKRESTGTKEKVAAQIYLGEWLKGEAADKGNATIYTVADLWDLYFERHVEKNNVDKRSSETCWRNLKVHFGDLILPEVTQRDADGVDKVEEYILKRLDGEIGDHPAATGTIRGELARMLAAIRWHAHPKQKTINLADVPVFELPPASPPRDRWLRGEEIRRLMAAAAEHSAIYDGAGVAARSSAGSRMHRVERFLWLALETAARRQAILQLTWNRVDFEIGTIDYRIPGRQVTKKRRVVVPISKTLRPILLRAYEERTSDLVCDNESHSIWRAIKGVAKRAGVADVSPHVLRHTAATHMLRNGVPIWTVAGILGDTVETVEKTYGHHVPDGLAHGVEQISGGMLGTAKTQPGSTTETT